MSSILKDSILSTGQLEQQIFQAINSFGCKEPTKIPEDPCEAQRQFSQRLANAISDAVSKGVQQYLRNEVTTINQSTLEGSGGNDNLHVHPNVPQYNLNAP